MTTYYRPVSVSEVNDPDGHIDDCPWCSALMLANAASGGKHPPTIGEAEKIEIAAGGPFPLGGSPSLARDGLTKLLNFAPALATNPATIIAAAKPGTGLVVSGLYGNLPEHYRRWSSSFSGHHEAYAQVESSLIWWIDPLGPPNTGSVAGYLGEPISLHDLTAFAQGGLGGLYAPLHVIVTDPSPYAHTVQLLPGVVRLNVHATPHQQSTPVAHMPANAKAITNELLVHGEAYVVGSTNHTDWLRVTFTGKVGWIKRGWTKQIG